MANSSYRVNIPENTEELLDLATKVYHKHTNLTAPSPLRAMGSHIRS